MAPKDRIISALLSDVGRVRVRNEDSLAQDQAIGLLVLADGMGGHNAGEVASGIATAVVKDVSRREWPRLQAGQADRRSGHRVETLLLRSALEQAHQAILQAAQGRPEYAGMGTTAVACLLGGGRLSIAYVGDSRLYRLRGGTLQQVTRDHSLLEEAVARGDYTREEARRRFSRNVLSRALGVEPGVEVELIEEDLQRGDVVLLCSDGLTDMVDDQGIEQILTRCAGDLDTAAQLLVRRANARGGSDNISVALARVDAAPPQ